MQIFQIVMSAALVFLCNLASAQVAASCVHLTEGKNSRLLKNICDQPITVFMCHDAPTPVGSSSAECGRKGRLYQMHFELSPGESGGNQFQSPFGSAIAYGACFGSIFVKPYIVKGDSGAYECKVLEKNRGLGLEANTSHGKTHAEACGGAREIAGAPTSPCNCNGEEGKRVICKVTVLREKHKPSAQEEAREVLRQRLMNACKNSGDCPLQNSVATATRG